MDISRRPKCRIDLKRALSTCRQTIPEVSLFKQFLVSMGFKQTNKKLDGFYALFHNMKH